MTRLRESINEVVISYDRMIRSAKSERVAGELLKEKKRWLCRNDLYYLCCLTGHEGIKKHPEIFQDFCDEVSLINWVLVKYGVMPPSQDMLPISKVVDDDSELVMERAYLCYRSFYKTTIVNKVNSLQLILNFPNIRIALLHNRQENASDNLNSIKSYFLNTMVGRLFPEYLPEGKDWGNSHGFSVACRTDSSASEDTIEAIGVGTEITGRHWHVAKKDDLVTQDSVTTDDQIKKTQDYDDRFNVGHFVDSKFKIQDYSGTRYHFYDLYSVISNNPNIKLIKIPIEDGKGNPTHPTRFTVADIAKIKSDMRSIWVYNCQMMLNPDDPAKMTFSTSMIVYYEAIPSPCSFYLLVDPAGKRKKKSDYTAMLVVAVDGYGKRYIVDGIRDKIDPQKRINRGIELAKKYGVLEVGWEEVGLADDTFYLEEKRRVEGLFFTITPIKAQQIAKEDRIRNILCPEYAEHQWLWPKKGVLVKVSEYDGMTYDLVEELEKEFIQFPLCIHDDLMDCQTFLSRLSVIKPELAVEREERAMTYGDLHVMMDERQNALKESKWKNLRGMSRV